VGADPALPSVVSTGASPAPVPCNSGLVAASSGEKPGADATGESVLAVGRAAGVASSAGEEAVDEGAAEQDVGASGGLADIGGGGARHTLEPDSAQVGRTRGEGGDGAGGCGGGGGDDGAVSGEPSSGRSMTLSEPCSGSTEAAVSRGLTTGGVAAIAGAPGGGVSAPPPSSGREQANGLSGGMAWEAGGPNGGELTPSSPTATELLWPASSEVVPSTGGLPSLSSSATTNGLGGERVLAGSVATSAAPAAVTEQEARGGVGGVGGDGGDGGQGGGMGGGARRGSSSSRAPRSASAAAAAATTVGTALEELLGDDVLAPATPAHRYDKRSHAV